jgi:hypothetical protein
MHIQFGALADVAKQLFPDRGSKQAIVWLVALKNLYGNPCRKRK